MNYCYSTSKTREVWNPNVRIIQPQLYIFLCFAFEELNATEKHKERGSTVKGLLPARSYPRNKLLFKVLIPD